MAIGDIGKLGAIQALLSGGGLKGPAGSRLRQLLDELIGGTQANARSSAASQAGGAQAAAQAGGAQAAAQAGGCNCPNCKGGCKGGACKCCGGNCARCRKLRGR